MQPDDEEEVSLIIRAAYDPENEAVGIGSEGSGAFEAGPDTRAKIEILAAISAKANCLAAAIIRDWPADETRKKALVDHYAALKENMLNDMLEQMDGADSSEAKPEVGDD